MDSNIFAARGFVQELPGGWVFEIGNGALTRRIQCIAGRIGTTSLLHNLNAEEYLEETVEEFSADLVSDGRRVTLSFREFVYQGHETPVWDEEECRLVIRLQAELEGSTIPAIVTYTARGGAEYISKSVVVDDSATDWAVESIIIEHLRFKEMVEGVTPTSRYTNQFETGEDDVHTDPDKASVENPNSRFQFAGKSRSLVTYWGFNEGLWFFTEDLLGDEWFDRDSGLVMRQKYTSGVSKPAEAYIGAYAGQPEVAFKRYREFMDGRCVIGEKLVPVEWNTWYVTRGRNPVLTSCDRNLILDELPRLKEAGFYDVLHLDLGWEARKPLLPSAEKFPNGLAEIVHKASEAGLNMAYWVNPFSSNYWKSDIEDEHPEWLNPAKVSGQSGAHAICPLTQHFDYVRERLTDIVTTHNARLIFWDGGDWNAHYCTSADHDHKSERELEVKTVHRLAALARELRELRPDLIISAFSLPFDNHKLGVLDQQEISDTYAFPTGQAELIQRQQLYRMAWEHPFRAIRSSWHGVDWHEASTEELRRRPLRELVFAEMSMLGFGAPPAGGSIDLAGAPEPFVQFLQRMFVWRKHFERYFRVYQHILGFPDGVSVDGEAHIIDGKGFLLLINPSEEEQTVNLPLDEPELEMPDSTVSVYDWSDFENGRFLGRTKVSKPMQIELTGREVRVIGIDIAKFEEEEK